MRSNNKARRYTNVRELAQKQREGQNVTYLKLPKGVKLFKPKIGIMLLDILPFEAGKGNPFAERGLLHWERSFWVHNNVGVNNDRVICPAKSFKEKCPICELRVKLRKNEDDNEEQIKSLGLSHRQIFNIFNRKDPDSGVQIFDISHFCFGAAILDAINSADEDEDIDTFFLGEGGKTLKVNFEEESFSGSKFMKAARVDFKDRKEDLDDDVIEQAACLDELIEPLEYTELKKMVLAIDDDDDDEEEEEEEDDDDDDRPAPKHKAKASRDDDEDEDDDDEDEPKAKKKKSSSEEEDDDDDEEEEPKAKKKKPSKHDDWDDFDEDDEEPKAKKKKKVSDEEEDEEDEEDDDDEPPKSKKKKSMFARQKGDKGWDADEEEDDD